MDWVVNAILGIIIGIVLCFVGGVAYFLWVAGYPWVMVAFIVIVVGVLWWISGD